MKQQKQAVTRIVVLDGVEYVKLAERRVVYADSWGSSYVRVMGRRVPVKREVDGAASYEWHYHAVSKARARNVP